MVKGLGWDWEPFLCLPLTLMSLSIPIPHPPHYYSSLLPQPYPIHPIPLSYPEPLAPIHSHHSTTMIHSTHLFCTPPSPYPHFLITPSYTHPPNSKPYPTPSLPYTPLLLPPPTPIISHSLHSSIHIL